MDRHEIAEVARGEYELQIDRLIADERDPEGRALLRRNRARMIDRLVDATVIEHLERRCAELDARLRPTLVETP